MSISSVAEWSKALESDASAGGESPVRAPVRAATLPLRVVVCVFVAGTAQRPESVSVRRGPCPTVQSTGHVNVRIKFCHSTGIARSGGGVKASTTSYA